MGHRNGSMVRLVLAIIVVALLVTGGKLVISEASSLVDVRDARISETNQ